MIVELSDVCFASVYICVCVCERETEGEERRERERERGEHRDVTYMEFFVCITSPSNLTTLAVVASLACHCTCILTCTYMYVHIHVCSSPGVICIHSTSVLGIT